MSTILLLLIATILPSFSAEPGIAYEKYELDNGLDVILSEDHSTPIVHVNIWYHVGAKDEEVGLTGFAHLFEHLMFQGSLSSPGEYFTPLQEVGAKINGTTSFDRTNYFETLPSHHLPLALFMESDRMGWLLEVLGQDKLDNQREVVRNERRQRYENPPYGEAWKDLYAATWPTDHPYNHMPIGSHEDLQAASLDTVSDFFKTWYVPNNASLVICGDFDPEPTKALVQELFGSIPKGPDVTHKTAPLPKLTESRELRQYDDVPERKVWLAYLSPGLHASGDAELDLFGSVLSSGKDSRLTRALIKEQKIAKSVSARQGSLMLGSVFVISATAAKGHTTDEVVKAIDAVIADVLSEHPPTDEEIDSAKANYEAGFYRRISSISGKANLLNGYNYWEGDPGYMAKDLERYRQPTTQDTIDVARDILGGHRTALHILPQADKPAVADSSGGEKKGCAGCKSCKKKSKKNKKKKKKSCTNCNKSSCTSCKKEVK